MSGSREMHSHPAISNSMFLNTQILITANFSLSPEKWNIFCAALDQPARSIPTLTALLITPGLLDAKSC